MRLWHKDLIEVLPRQQLLGQWRECCLIAKNIAEKGTPNHLLVNKIMDYPIEHFYSYAKWVEFEMRARGYKCDFGKFEKLYKQIAKDESAFNWQKKDLIFMGWHNPRYFDQCFYNLQEKYDCGGIPKDEWQKFRKHTELLRVTKNVIETFNAAATALKEYTDGLEVTGND